jgi:hypothetical protein
MGEVVDMTGRVVVADEHPLGVESVRDVSIENRQILRRAWDEAPEVARYFADRHGLDYDDAVICLVDSLVKEAFQARDRVEEARFVLEFIAQAVYRLVIADTDSSESS